MVGPPITPRSQAEPILHKPDEEYRFGASESALSCARPKQRSVKHRQKSRAFSVSPSQSPRRYLTADNLSLHRSNPPDQSRADGSRVGDSPGQRIHAPVLVGQPCYGGNRPGDKPELVGKRKNHGLYYKTNITIPIPKPQPCTAVETDVDKLLERLRECLFSPEELRQAMGVPEGEPSTPGGHSGKGSGASSDDDGSRNRDLAQSKARPVDYDPKSQYCDSCLWPGTAAHPPPTFEPIAKARHIREAQTAVKPEAVKPAPASHAGPIDVWKTDDCCLDNPLTEFLVQLEACDQKSFRRDYLSFADMYLVMAFIASKRSKDPVIQAGALLVTSTGLVLGYGWNGMPLCLDDDAMPWGRYACNRLESKYPYVVHAEANAIYFAACPCKIKGSTMYCTMFPCNECAKLIIQSQVSNIVYYSDKECGLLEVIVAKKLFDIAGVKYLQHCPACRKTLIDFDEINRDVLPCSAENAGYRGPPLPRFLCDETRVTCPTWDGGNAAEPASAVHSSHSPVHHSKEQAVNVVPSRTAVKFIDAPISKAIDDERPKPSAPSDSAESTATINGSHTDG